MEVGKSAPKTPKTGAGRCSHDVMSHPVEVESRVQRHAVFENMAGVSRTISSKVRHFGPFWRFFCFCLPFCGLFLYYHK